MTQRTFTGQKYVSRLRLCTAKAKVYQIAVLNPPCRKKVMSKKATELKFRAETKRDKKGNNVKKREKTMDITDKARGFPWDW